MDNLRLAMALLKLTQAELEDAEARHRRHLARLRWRRTQPRDPSGCYRDPWQYDRALYRAEMHEGMVRRLGWLRSTVRKLPLSGPRPSAWSAYLAAEARAQKREALRALVDEVGEVPSLLATRVNIGEAAASGGES